MRGAPVMMVVLAAACGSGAGSVIDSGPGDPDGSAAETVVVIETSMGDLVVELYPDEMPVTTTNFLSYLDDGWYDGTLIHRVEDDWVIQGGGYTTGLVAKTARAPIPLETSAQVSHVHGAISMARTSDPDSATSQWFIVDWPDAGTPPQPGTLDGQYAAFGLVIEGLDVLAAITQVATTTSGPLQNVPVTEIAVSAAHRR